MLMDYREEVSVLEGSISLCLLLAGKESDFPLTKGLNGPSQANFKKNI